MGDGVKAPAKRARAHIEGANVSGRRRIGFGIPAADDDQILVNDAGAGEVDGLSKVISAQSLAQIDSSLLAKGGNDFARLCIERVEIMRYAGQDSTMLAVSPVGETAGRLLAGHPGIKFPEKLTG